MIKRTLKKTEVKAKDDFLNDHQRKELQRVLVEKFVKIKGRKNEKIIKEMV